MDIMEFWHIQALGNATIKDVYEAIPKLHNELPYWRRSCLYHDKFIEPFGQRRLVGKIFNIFSIRDPTMDELLEKFHRDKSTGKKLMFSSIFVWILSLLVATSGLEFGVIVWAISLIILACGFLVHEISKSKINEREEYVQLKLLSQFGVESLNQMNGVEFEKFLARIFTILGYKASLTRTTGDFGVDLLLKKDSIKIAVQAKRSLNNVGNKAVQEVYTGMRHYDADEGWVITNSGFTGPAYTQAQSVNVRLIGGDDLSKYIIQAYNSKNDQ